MTIIFTGDGKGKTSAALGVALRSSGWGNKVAVVQFIKGNKEIGEWKAIQKIGGIDIFQYLNDKKLYIANPEKRHRDTMPAVMDDIGRLAESGDYSLVVLDEVNNAINHKLVKVKKIVSILKTYPKTDFILTGRNADPELVKMADMVTEMRNIKHPFDRGVPAKKGIDY